MFEVFGWAVVRANTYDSDNGAERAIVDELERRAKTVRIKGQVSVHLDLALNGDTHAVSVAGSRNHRYELVIDLFRWLAEAAPGSYGVLYVHDDEGANSDRANAFTVYRLVRGTLGEYRDHLLSPLIPTIEDPYEPDREDTV